MQPVSQDISIYRGDAFDFYFRIRYRVWNPALNGGLGGYEAGDGVDLTGWSGLAQIRADEDAGSTLGVFTITFANQADMNTRGGVLLTLTGAQTQALPATGGVWDVQLTNTLSEPRTFYKGAVTVTKDVSRV